MGVTSGPGNCYRNSGHNSSSQLAPAPPQSGPKSPLSHCLSVRERDHSPLEVDFYDRAVSQVVDNAQDEAGCPCDDASNCRERGYEFHGRRW